MKTVLVTGGGSGGHITPILAVASEIKRLRPDVRVVYVGQKGDGLGDIPAHDPNIDQTYVISAGKFRRYHGEGLRQLLDVPTIALNIRDVFRILRGCWQSRRLLKRIKPDVIFIKGGFVGVPIAVAAAQARIPFVTHDSDALPGLANRLTARWATMHAVGMPLENYSYPLDKMRYVGIPLQPQYSMYTADDKLAFRRFLAVPGQALMVFVTGGGLGAKRLNDAVAACLPQLLAAYPNMYMFLQPGRQNETEVRQQFQELAQEHANRVTITRGFVSDMWTYYGAADVVITRAGATNIAECAALSKPTIIVPNPLLTGGHQLKNAAHLAETGAAVVVQESALKAEGTKALLEPLTLLLNDPAAREAYGARLALLAHPHAASDVAALLLEYTPVSATESV